MPLRIETVHSLENRRQELAGETVKVDNLSASSKAIKDHILANLGGWKRTGLGKILRVNELNKKTLCNILETQGLGNGSLARMGAALARKPMGKEGDAVLEVLKRVNEKSLGVKDAMSAIGRLERRLERQYAASHGGAPISGDARMFFANARKCVLMAPMVAQRVSKQNVPDERTQVEVETDILDISGQYDYLEYAINANSLQDVDTMRAIYGGQLQKAIQDGNTEMADSLQMIMKALDSKRVMLQELANITAQLSSPNGIPNGIPSDQTMQEVGAALETMAQACLTSNGRSGGLHDLGRASLIGAVQHGFTEFYGALHRQDMARIATLQGQLEKIDFSNQLAVDWTSVDGLFDQISNVGDKWYSQEILNEESEALEKLRQTAQLKSLLVRLRTLESDFAGGRSVGRASLEAIENELEKFSSAKDTATYKALESHKQKLWGDMDKYASKRVLKPLKVLRDDLTAASAARDLGQLRACGRRIEDELKIQMDFLRDQNAPVSDGKQQELIIELNKLSADATKEEFGLLMDSLKAGGQHTLQEIADSLASQTHLNSSAVKDKQAELEDFSRANKQTAFDRLDEIKKQIPVFNVGDRSQVQTVFARLQAFAGIVSPVRENASHTMLAEDRKVVEAKCREVEALISQQFTETMQMLPDDWRIDLSESAERAVGELCLKGGFDARLAMAIVELRRENKVAWNELIGAINARLDGRPIATKELFAKLDVLLEKDPNIADVLYKVKLGLASGMDEKKVRLLHEAAVARNNFDRTMEEPGKNLAMQNLGFYYFKESKVYRQLIYMLGKIEEEKNRMSSTKQGKANPLDGLNMAILKHLWLEELTKDVTDDSPLPDVKARFAGFQANLPEPFKSNKDLFTAMAFDVKDLSFVENFGKSLAKLSKTMDGARELQAAFNVCAGQDDVFAARKALEGLTRRYASGTSAPGESSMPAGASGGGGLFVACEALHDKLVSAFHLENIPPEEREAVLQAFAGKAEDLRSTSVLLMARAREQMAVCRNIVDDVAKLKLDDAVSELQKADNGAFNPNKVGKAGVAVCTLALLAAVKGIQDDLDAEQFAETEEERKAAEDRMQTRYELLVNTHFPRGMSLSSMTSDPLRPFMDEDAGKLENLRKQIEQLPKDNALNQKMYIVAVAKQIEAFLDAGKYEEKAMAALVYARGSKGTASAQEIWSTAFQEAGLADKKAGRLEKKFGRSDINLKSAREMVNKRYPQELAGKAVRAEEAKSMLSKEAARDFEAAKKSLDETRQMFDEQVNEALSDAVQIAVLDTFLRSDPPLENLAALLKKLPKLTDQRALQECQFFKDCQKTLHEKLFVPEGITANYLIDFLSRLDDNTFQDMARTMSPKSAQTFRLGLLATERSPMERVQHREDTLRRTTALISTMTEPEAMVTFNLEMTHGSSVPILAGLTASGSRRQMRALGAGMAVRREGSEFRLTLSPKATNKMGKQVAKALEELDGKALDNKDTEETYSEGLELHFENGEKCAEFLADLLSGELEMSSFQNCSAIDMLGMNDYELISKRVNIFS